jgi:WD40 repeat protein/beta-lactamase regulating signal transducer with metallopeptidase domain
MNSTSLWLAIGWTMLHFLWIGCVIWAGSAVVLRQLRAATAEVRYAVALASLVLLALAPPAIAWQLACASGSIWSGKPPVGQDQARPDAVAPAREDGGVIVIGEIQKQGDRASAVPVAVPPVGVDRLTVSRASWLSARLDALAACVPWLWLVGSPLTFAWLALGLAGAERLRRRSLPLKAESDLSQLCRRLAVGFGIGRDVAVAVCDRVATPVLVGIVRPLILLPVAAMGGWGPEQIEMVLLHELAHVRRWDNLVNLLQRLVESLLFFHPAVWIVSGWIRQEREHCCDRIVVLHTGRACAYAETLLALASEPAPLAAISVALVPRRKHLASRIRHILTPREDHPMKLSRSLILIVAIVILAPAFWIASLAQSQPVQKAQTSQNVAPAGASAPGQAEQVKPKDEKVNKPAVVIQGKPLSDWMTALKDRDPAVRLRAVEVLGDVTQDQAGDQFFNLQSEVSSSASMDKDPGVRKAAAAAESLLLFRPTAESRLQMLEAQKRAIPPTSMPLRLVDAQGQPVVGAIVGSYFWRVGDGSTSFTPANLKESSSSDARGEASLKLAIGGHQEGTAVCAIQQGKDRPLIGLSKVARAEIGKPVTVVMYPACRVRLRAECSGFRELEAKYQIKLNGSGWWAAQIQMGDDNNAPKPLWTNSATGEFELFLPPGRFTVAVYGSDTMFGSRLVEIKAGERDRDLGVIDVPPSEGAKQGSFPHHRQAQQQKKKEAEAKNKGSLRHAQRLELKGDSNAAQDLAFSPDGKILATAHWYTADPGEVKLWDTSTGALIATLPVPAKDGGVIALAFSPDGRTLAGSVGPLPSPKPPGVVVLWDVASRRESRRLGGHTARITGLAFSPDGRTVASSGEDKTVRFWDVATGRATGRIEGNPNWVRSVGYSPDGKTLAIGGWPIVKLWDVPGNRLRAMLEPEAEQFWVESVAYSPDGRTLAAAGAKVDRQNDRRQGQVRLYDMTQDPPRRRAVLPFHFRGEFEDEKRGPSATHVAFTPDGHHLAAVGEMSWIVIWDTATGIEQDSFERASSHSINRRVAFSPARRLAIVGSSGPVTVLDIRPPAP